MAFQSMNLPYVSMTYPEVDFSGLPKVGTALGVGYSNRRLKNSMEDPANSVVDENGNVDWDKASKVLLMDRPWEAYNQGGGMFGGVDAETYGKQPVYGLKTNPDGSQDTVAFAPSDRGTLKPYDLPPGYSVTEPQQMVLGTDGYEPVPRKGLRRNMVGGQATQPAPQPPGVTSYRDPEDPGFEEGALGDEPPEWLGGRPAAEPMRMGPQGDFGDEGVDEGVDEVPGANQGVEPRVELDRGEIEFRKQLNELAAKSAHDYPGFENSVRGMVEQLSALENNPNLDRVLGTVGGKWTPESMQDPDQAEVQSMINYFKSRQFLIAYAALRGAGAITEVEGLKGEQAMTRLGEQGMSPPAYRRAIKEAKTELIRLVNVARQKAKMNPYNLPDAQEKPSNRPMSVEEWRALRNGGN